MEILPTPQFFYGLGQGQEIAVELEAGKDLIVKLLTVSDPHPEGTRTIFFELNGQPREVTVRDISLRAAVPTRPKADPGSARTSGIADSRRHIQASPWKWENRVKKGDRLHGTGSD